MEKIIEYNRILSSIYQIRTIDQINPIENWIRLFGEHYRSSTMKMELESELIQRIKQLKINDYE